MTVQVFTVSVYQLPGLWRLRMVLFNEQRIYDTIYDTIYSIIVFYPNVDKSMNLETHYIDLRSLCVLAPLREFFTKPVLP